jgi:hypothetical protein
MEVDGEEPVLDFDGERKLKTKKTEEIEAKLPNSNLSNSDVLLLLDVNSSLIKISTPTGKRGGKVIIINSIHAASDVSLTDLFLGLETFRRNIVQRN